MLFLFASVTYFLTYLLPVYGILQSIAINFFLLFLDKQNSCMKLVLSMRVLLELTNGGLDSPTQVGRVISYTQKNYFVSLRYYAILLVTNGIVNKLLFCLIKPWSKCLHYPKNVQPFCPRMFLISLRMYSERSEMHHRHESQNLKEQFVLKPQI